MSLNSVSSPPSFDAIFNNQARTPNVPVTDEPQSFDPSNSHSLSRRGSHSSLNSNGRPRQGSSSSQMELAIDPRIDGRMMEVGNGNGQRRQYSFPYDDPAYSTSTLEATAKSPIPFPQLYQDGQYQPNWSGQDGMGQYGMLPPNNNNNHQQNPYHPHAASPLGLPNDNNYLANNGDYQNSPYHSPGFQPNQATWGNEFVDQTPGDYNSEQGSRRTSWIADEEQQAMDVLVYDHQEDDDHNGLQRIISNASSHGSQHHLPHSAPPNMYADQLQQQQQQAINHQTVPPPQPPSANQFNHRRNDSLTSQHARRDSLHSHSSRSPSPFNHGINVNSSPPGSASFHRASTSSLTGSPFMNKPISPPALIIPNNASPSPQLPPIITSTSTSNPSSSGNNLPRAGGSMNSLFPPANPLLTGMAGISPIGPNADGPKIFVQPSTPISGLNDGRGIFDAAIRRAGAAQQAQTQNQGYNHQSSQSSSMPNNDLNNNQPQIDQNAANNALMAAYLSQFSGGAKSEGGMRPRAKSDSYAMEGIDRQSMIQFLLAQQYLGQPQGQNTDVNQNHDPSLSTHPSQGLEGGGGQYGVDPGEQWQQTINAWRTTLSNPSQQQPTVDPRVLPGNQTEYNQSLLQQFSLLQSQVQSLAQQNQNQARGKLPSLDTTQTTPEGMFKYQPGEFSPTSLSFYASLGVQPGFPGGGTTSAPSFNTSFNLSSLPPNGAMGEYPQTAGPAFNGFMIPQNPVVPTSLFGALSGMGNGHGNGSGEGGLGVPSSVGMHGRRRSYGGEGGQNHPASGAGTPGYGMMFNQGGVDGGGTTNAGGRVRGLSPGGGHRRNVKSEDLGRGTGWGMGGGGSTTDFLQSITNPSDGTLLPPTSRGRSSSHSHHSSSSSIRSVSPALSISSQGSSYSNNGRMSMSDINVPGLYTSPSPGQSPYYGTDDGGGGYGAEGAGAAGGGGGGGGRRESLGMGRRSVSGGSGSGGSGSVGRIAKQKVTSVATEVASSSRRTNNGIFQCPVPGCNSTFTRHFNLKGHLRSHNDERPYKCLYDGCPKAVVGFARQHDCKRHMLLHEGLRPFECEGCGKKFARLDALTRHHKSEQGQECAISHPLPTNPDGSFMSESQYKAYKNIQSDGNDLNRSTSGGGAGGGRRKSSTNAIPLPGYGGGSGDPYGVQTGQRGGVGGGGMQGAVGGFGGYQPPEFDDDEDELRSLGDWDGVS